MKSRSDYAILVHRIGDNMGIVNSDRLLVKYYMNQIEKNNKFKKNHSNKFNITDISSPSRMMEVDKKIEIGEQEIGNKISKICNFSTTVSEQITEVDGKMGSLFSGVNNG